MPVVCRLQMMCCRRLDRAGPETGVSDGLGHWFWLGSQERSRKQTNHISCKGTEQIEVDCTTQKEGILVPDTTAQCQLFRSSGQIGS